MANQYLTIGSLSLLLSLSLPQISPLVPIAVHGQTSEDQIGEAIKLYQEGVALYEQSKFVEAIAAFKVALEKVRAIGERLGEQATLDYLGNTYAEIGQYNLAIETLGQALIIAQEREDREGEGRILTYIGSVYSRLSEYDKAEELYQQAAVIVKEIGDRGGESALLNNLAGLAVQRGQYSQVLDYYQQSLAISRELGDIDGEWRTLNNIALAYKFLGQYESALEYYEQSLATARQDGDRLGEGVIIDNIAGVYGELREHEKSLNYRLQALAIFRELGSKVKEATSLNNIATNYRLQGDYEKAIEFYQQALALNEGISSRETRAIIIDNMSSAYDHLGNHEKAKALSLEALAIFREVGNRRSEGIVLHNLGLRGFEQNNLEVAAKYLFAAVEVWESLRPGLTDANKVSLFETQADTYRLLQEVLLLQKKPEAALEVSERGRARAFAELLASRLNAQTEEPIELPKAPNLARIKEIAQQQQATLVEYSLNEDQVYIWVIQPEGKIDFRSAQLRGSDNNEKTNNLNQAVAETRSALFGSGSSTTKLKEFHQALIAPIADLLPQDPQEQVIFIPQGILYLIPFPALQDQAGKYLIEKHTILTAPSIQVLDLTRQQKERLEKTPKSEVLVVGNPQMPFFSFNRDNPPQPLAPLPGAEEEAIAIAKLFNTKVLTGKAAQEATVVPLMPEAKIIHLATHGLLDELEYLDLDIPGAIALAPSATEDGFLTSGEIFDLQLNAELVVLSACNTGRGDITGDGVVGLSRSFISAGVPSLVVSLWAVPDNPTMDLMTEFYRQMQEEPNKARALRQAMLRTMKLYPDPIDWAAFTLIGES